MIRTNLGGTEINALGNYMGNQHSLSQQKASPVVPCMFQQRFRLVYAALLALSCWSLSSEAGFRFCLYVHTFSAPNSVSHVRFCKPEFWLAMHIYMLCWSFWFFPLPSLFLFIILSCSLTSKMLSFLSSTLVLPHKIKSEFFILLVIFGFLAPI